MSPFVFSTTMNNINWSIGLEVTLSVLGFTDINTPTIGVMIYWANQHTALVAGVWWWILFPVLLVVIAFVGLFLLGVVAFNPPLMRVFGAETTVLGWPLLALGVYIVVFAGAMLILSMMGTVKPPRPAALPEVPRP